MQRSRKRSKSTKPASVMVPVPAYSFTWIVQSGCQWWVSGHQTEWATTNRAA